MSKKTHEAKVARAKSRTRGFQRSDEKFYVRMDRKAGAVVCALYARLNITNADMFIFFDCDPVVSHRCDGSTTALDHHVA